MQLAQDLLTDGRLRIDEDDLPGKAGGVLSGTARDEGERETPRAAGDAPS